MARVRRVGGRLMSVTITPVLPHGCSWGERLEPCMCAGGESWADAYEAAVAGRDVEPYAASLRATADPTCRQCGGAGLAATEDLGPLTSWSDDTASRLFPLLGWTSTPNGYVGRVQVGVARRDLALARRRLKSGARVLERAEEVGPMCAVQGDDGLACVSPRFFSAGLDRAGMAERLDALERLLDEADRFGLAEVEWS